MVDARFSRRGLLRYAALSSAGLIGAYALGCGDSDDGPAAPATITLPPDEPTPGGQATEAAPGISWERLSPQGSLPPPRRDHSLVTDGASLYLFGGRAGAAAMNDLWIYDIGANAWTLNDSGTIPPELRFGHNAVWDPVGLRMIVFGGQHEATFWDNTYQYNPTSSTWQRVAPTGPSVPNPAARYGAASALDGDGRLLISHGFTDTGRFDDTWQLESGALAWADVSPPDARPLARCLVRGVWDARKSRLLMYGGQSNEAPFMDDLWAWYEEPLGWSRITREPHPSARNLYAMVYDRERLQTVLIGGRTSSGPANDVWLFHSDGETWTAAAPDGEPPSPRSGLDAAITDDGAIYIFGGQDASGDLNDLWVLRRA
jgi:hypothetical protein